VTDRQSKKTMWYRLFQQDCNNACTNAVQHFKLVKETLGQSMPKETRTYVYQNNFYLQFRWRLFEQMAARCQLGQKFTPTPNRNSKRHKLGKTTQGFCAAKTCDKRTIFGCETCDLRLCSPWCLDDHICDSKHVMKYRTQRGAREWAERPT